MKGKGSAMPCPSHLASSPEVGSGVLPERQTRPVFTKEICGSCHLSNLVIPYLLCHRRQRDMSDLLAFLSK